MFQVAKKNCFRSEFQNKHKHIYVERPLININLNNLTRALQLHRTTSYLALTTDQEATLVVNGSMPC